MVNILLVITVTDLRKLKYNSYVFHGMVYDLGIM